MSEEILTPAEEVVPTPEAVEPEVIAEAPAEEAAPVDFQQVI